VKGAAFLAEQWLVLFRKEFGDDRVCAEHLSKLRWPEGFVCCCGERRAWFLKSRAMYECIGCRRQTSIKTGTAMHGSKLPLTVWFWAAYLITEFELSIRELRKLLGISYKSAWWLRRTFFSLQNIKEDIEEISIKPEKFELLDGLVEVSQIEFTSDHYNRLSRKVEFHRIVIALAVEVISDEGASSLGGIRIANIRNGSAKSIAAFVQANVKPGATLLTDGHRSYRELSGYNLDPRYHGKQSPRSAHVIVLIKGWFKADILDPAAVDRALEYIRTNLAPQNPELNREEPFETLLRLALRSEPR
jgi:transposase-like protein